MNFYFGLIRRRHNKNIQNPSIAIGGLGKLQITARNFNMSVRYIVTTKGNKIR